MNLMYFLIICKRGNGQKKNTPFQVRKDFKLNQFFLLANDTVYSEFVSPMFLDVHRKYKGLSSHRNSEYIIVASLFRLDMKDFSANRLFGVFCGSFS